MEDKVLKISYKGININAKVIFRKRKNVTIQIKPKSNITLISPNNVSEEILKSILIENGDWILKKLEEFKNIEFKIEERKFESGEEFYYLGKLYRLKIEENFTEEVYIEGDELVVKSKFKDKENVEKILKWWYKRESQKIIIERIQYYRDKSEIMMALIPNSIKVKEQKKRWGSCTSNREIYINSKISMARIESIDYILIHEFSHLMHMNHSKEFYSLVEQIMPDYKKEAKWLKENSHKLIL